MGPALCLKHISEQRARSWHSLSLYENVLLMKTQLTALLSSENVYYSPIYLRDIVPSCEHQCLQTYSRL